ncbi:MAG: FecR family protein [Treponema sp.]|jgi:hypothetical protein|nr:FecR family protein [Treponema sp.]
MSGITRRASDKPFRFRDFFVIVLCLSVAAAGINLFRLDLFQTLDSQNEEPIGTITIKHNTVQRRIANRVLWDRLSKESPVYIGDIIRVADLSDATLYIDGNSIELGENTLIRILRSADGESFQVELSAGNLGLTTSGDGAAGNMTLNIMGRELQAAPGTKLNAAAGQDGMKVELSEGSALLIEEGSVRDVSSGTMLALDAGGIEKLEPSVMVTQPRQNAKFLKNSKDPLNIGFAWNRQHLEPEETLCLEISRNRNFTQIFQLMENLNNEALTALDVGLWYWRLVYENTPLSAGSFTVTAAAAPEPLSPVPGSVYRYRDELPKLQFQWSETEEAQSYLVEVSQTPQFENPQFSRQTAAVFFTDSSLGQGTWYWRVKPVFPSVYEAASAYSSAVSFRIEHHIAEELAHNALVLELPEPSVLQSVDLQSAIEPEPLPPLPAPGNRRPTGGYVITLEELMSSQSVVFSWQAVPGANAYIFTLYQQTANGRRQILRRAPENRTGLTITNLSLLDRGSFIWQVEAISQARDGTIERQGRVVDNLFVLDIPAPSLQADEPGILYGN